MSLDFGFSQEGEEFRAFVRELAEQEIAPHVAEWDEKEEMPWHAINKMGEAGLLGIIGKKHLGGQEKDYIMLGIAIEEVARVDNSCALICSVQNTMGTLIPGWGDEIVRDVIRGDKLLCIATSEVNAGSDMTAMITKAEIDGDEYIINGHKIHVSLMPGAHFMGVTVKVPTGDGNHRISFLKVPSDLPGVSCEIMHEMGIRSHQLALVRFKNVRVPMANTLGGGGEGKALLYARWNVARCLSALNALGAAQAVLDQTIDFVKKKKVYGAPIGMYQAIQFPIVEFYTKIEACRLLAYKGLWLNNQGADAAKESTMAKWFGVTLAVETIQQCLQMFGARGYLKDMPIERRLRDVMGLLFTGGTINVMKLVVVRELLGKEFMGFNR